MFLIFLDNKLAEASHKIQDSVSYRMDLIFNLSAINSTLIRSPHNEFLIEDLCVNLFFKPELFVNEAILNVEATYVTGNDTYTAESVIKLVREELVRKTITVN